MAYNEAPAYALLSGGVVPVSSGGTGLSSVTAHDLMIGNGISPLTLLAPSATSGVAVISQGAAADPAYGTVVVAGGGTGATTLTGLLTGNGTSAVTATAITQYNVLTGGASNAPNSVAPSATSGVPVISQGAAAQPIFGTAVVAGGGTGATTLTGLLTGNGTSAVTGTAITQYNILTGGASNVPNSVAPSATSGVPVISQGSAAQPIFGTAVVAGGGTGVTSNTAYAVLCGGTTSTGAIQSIASVGTSGQVLTSNGAAALPTFQAAPTSSVVIQQVRTSSTAVDSTSTALPADDTIPQNTEGKQLFSLAITPTNTSHILVIEAVVNFGVATTPQCALALFQDSTANALAVQAVFISSAGFVSQGTLRYYMTAGTTSSTTFNLRYGTAAGGTAYINQDGSGRLYGGVAFSSMTITEYTA